ncbi:MAG TPA: tRNA glutamyl-Q(34) synthetase GluQRS [Tepidisphaeraceae bacterium]|jgi:glutamyl-tRNA synthetase|nr:tRNA glutamyl-Q(34) synthetase GluQRS [Tepidisphaeraceae bacterium]
MQTTRLAPSPTGALHLGNARTFLANWALARQRGWKIILRIEDLDGPRIKHGADRQAIEDLQWLGIDWDAGPIYQSTRTEKYAAAMQQLIKSAAAYPCICSRSEVNQAASAPHPEDGSSIYPGACRGKFKSLEDAQRITGRPPALRFSVPDRIVEFNDQFRGPQRFDVAHQLGDFVIAKADGAAAYQLAIVIDDAEMGVTEIVRGDDLIDSTPRQILLYEALGLQDRIPIYYHLPLVVGTDGRRLAKRHGDTRLSYYRQLGVPSARMLTLLAKWCGINDTMHDASQLLSRFDLSKMPRDATVFTEAEDRFLRGK